MRNIAGADPGEIRSQIRARHSVLSVHLAGIPDQTTITSSMVIISSNSTTSVTCTISNAQPILGSTSTYTVAASAARSIWSTMTPLTSVLTSLANKTSIRNARSKLLSEMSAENLKAWLSPHYLFSLSPRSAKLSCRPQSIHDSGC